MRTQFLYVGLLSMTLAGGLVSAGCSDIHTGQPSDPGGPVKLVRVIVQDDDIAGGGGIGSAIDLLDRVGTPLSTAKECDPDRVPCNKQFVVGGGPADFLCDPDAASTGWEPSKTGFRCTDPLNPVNSDGTARPIPIQPTTKGPGTVSGTEIRLVFDKVLNSSELENIMVDTSQEPGKQLSYAVKDGIVDLLGPDGSSIPITRVWDPAGSPNNTSDVIGNPYGAAIVIKIGVLLDAMGMPTEDPTMGAPNYMLEEGVKYTVVVHTNNIHDRHGNGMADQNGGPLSGDYKIDFTTADLAPFGTPSPDISAGLDPKTKMLPAIATDEVIQFTFLNGVDENMLTATVASVTEDAAGMEVESAASFVVLAYTDRGKVATKCAANDDPTTVDVTAVNALGIPIPWPVGHYHLVLSAKKTTSFGNVSSYETEPGLFDFTVSADPMVMATAAQADHITPAQCAP